MKMQIQIDIDELYALLDCVLVEMRGRVESLNRDKLHRILSWFWKYAFETFGAGKLELFTVQYFTSPNLRKTHRIIERCYKLKDRLDKITFSESQISVDYKYLEPIFDFYDQMMDEELEMPNLVHLKGNTNEQIHKFKD
jgi:hypothetical protein